MADHEQFDFSQLNASGTAAGNSSKRQQSRQGTTRKSRRSKQKKPVGLIIVITALVLGIVSAAVLLLLRLSADNSNQTTTGALAEAAKVIPPSPPPASNLLRPATPERKPLASQPMLPDQQITDQQITDQQIVEAEPVDDAGSENSQRNDKLAVDFPAQSLAAEMAEMRFPVGDDVAASNLAASNLAASDLAASNLAASNLAASNLAASDLAASDLADNAMRLPENLVREFPEEYGVETILQLYRDRELFKEQQYKVLRSIYATRFELEHGDEIRQALGDEFAELDAWFKDHVAIREELYTAIRPQYDDVVGVIRMFDTLRRQFPQQIVSHAPLAIAVAVVWDNEKGVYRYGHHSNRTGSVMPTDLVDGVGNFQYFLNAERMMQGRGQHLPWEFLVNVVNHPTPMTERNWAVANYLPNRTMFGKCYSDVPYDSEMLASGSQQCRMNDREYTLANLRQYGGVCAMQADFAARVGKSLGVPAAYVSGKGRFGGSGHAWVMWVELKSVTPANIQFELKSHGRYRGDHYYVGNLRDPQTGQGITDRQLELRLQSIGISPLGKRRSEWLMDSFATVRDREELDVLEQIRYLNQVLTACPLSELAWRALADMSRDGLIQPKHEKMMLSIMPTLFNSFAAFPDFTWEIFDDLVQFQKLPPKRNALYERLVQLYELAGRPDLACTARLKHADDLVDAGKRDEAIAGLKFTILKFPQEGRYVPLLLDRLEAIAGDTPAAQQQVLALYRTFLPMIQQRRGDTASDYCVQMYQRGIMRFDQAGDSGTATLLRSELTRLSAN